MEQNQRKKTSNASVIIMCFPVLNGHTDDKHGGKPIEMVVKPHFPLEHLQYWSYSKNCKNISFLNVYQHGIYPHQKKHI